MATNKTKVVIYDDGPLEVYGPLTVVDEAGRIVEDVPEGEPVYLCRCGGSTEKPFCDGTHSKIGFAGAIRAVREAEGK